MLGKWNYKNEGIQDICHMKFFTLEEMTKMFALTGFKPSQIDEDIQDFTPDNIDFVKRLSSAVEVGPNFQRDSFVIQFVTKWIKSE